MVRDSPKPEGDTGEAVAIIVRIVVILLVGAGVPGLAWHWLKHDSHWIHNEKLMFVHAESWATGEYKDCATLNVDSEEPSMTCDANARGKTFKVRFDADTYVKDRPDSTAFHWICRRYAVGDATIDCEFKSAEGAVVGSGQGQRPRSNGRISVDAAQEIWTSEDEPPGRVIPQNGGCPEGYKPINHMNGVGGNVRHVDCVPVR